MRGKGKRGTDAGCNINIDSRLHHQSGCQRAHYSRDERERVDIKFFIGIPGRSLAATRNAVNEVVSTHKSREVSGHCQYQVAEKWDKKLEAPKEEDEVGGTKKRFQKMQRALLKERNSTAFHGRNVLSSGRPQCDAKYSFSMPSM